MKEHYQNRVKCIYIDPPYNTSASEIIYKNSYKNSSWLSFIEGRLLVANKLLANDGLMCVTIDDFEFHRLRALLENIYSRDCFLGVTAIKNNPSGRSTAKGFSIAHEYGIFMAKNEGTTIGRLTHSAEQLSRYKFKDQIGQFEWVNFRKHGGANANRTARQKLFYPILISGSEVRFPDVVWNERSNSWDLITIPKSDEKVIYPITPNGEEKTWKWGIETARENLEEFAVKKDQTGELGVYRKARLNMEGTLPLTVWDKKEYSSTEYGTNLLKRIFGESEKFSFPKSIHAVVDSLKVCNVDKRSIILDYFAGSGTTGHAVVNLNREDGGSRKYILVEMGDHFENALKPRIKKVIYSKDWRDGKPVSREGSSHMFKYIRLESYEDALNNLQLKRTQSQQELLDQNDPLREQYMLSYMLDVESAGSASLLNIAAFTNPFNYRMNIARGNETKETVVDLVETFNWLLGIKVLRISVREYRTADFACDPEGRLQIKDRPRSCEAGEGWTFKEVEGETLAGDKVLIIWRTLSDNPEQDNLMLDAWFSKRNYSTLDFEFSRIYVNGDNNLENLKIGEERWKVALIEEEFKHLMFSVEG
jgi:adenine-specific DNA-methyltransferase